MIGQFKSIIDLLKAFPDEQACIDHLTKLRWPIGSPVSPFDANSVVYVCKGNKFRCKNSKKYFNVKTGTIFEDSKIPLQKWFLALYVFSSHKKGVSSHQLAKDITVTQKTAWFMLHRLRYAFNHPNFNAPLEGTIEADESFIGGKSENKHESKKVRNEEGNLISSKAPVLGMRQRNGHLKAIVVKDVSSWTLIPLIKKHVTIGSTMYTDEHGGYNRLKHNYTHDSVKHTANEFVRGMVHTNGIENFWSHLKRGLTGIYHWASVKHLQAYVNEYALRFNTRDFKTHQRFNVVLENMTGRLTYKTLTA